MHACRSTLEDPTAARSGSTLAVAWSDSRAVWGDDIELTRLNASGSTLDANARTVSNATLNQDDVAGAGFGANFLYAWSDARNATNANIYMARVQASNGAILDPTGVLVSTGTDNYLWPSVASSGTEALVVWQSFSRVGATGVADIFGAIVASSGSASAPFVISNATGDQQVPAVTYDAAAGQYVVVWTDGRGGGSDIYGARVSRTGSVLDPAGVAIATGGTRHNPRIAAAGSTVITVYEQNADIFARHLTAGAALTVVGSELSITNNATRQYNPSIAGLASNFVVAWTDWRTSSTTRTDIYGQLINNAGNLVGANFAISTGAEAESSASIIDAGSNTALVSYTKKLTALDAARVMTRLIDATPALTGISITPTTASAPGNYKIQYTATGTYSDGSTQDLTTQVTWASSKTSVATISNSAGTNGLARTLAGGAGVTTISASFGGFTATGTLNRTTGATLTSITVTPASSTLTVGQTQQMTAIGHFSDGSTLDITNQVEWQSIRPQKLSVSTTGLAHALQVVPQVTIKATKSHVTGTATASVQ